MARSKREIQKAYRERQKATGPAFLDKERRRQQQYYVPAALLNYKKRAERNLKNKMRNRLSRERKRLQQQRDDNAVEETSGYETLNAETEEDTSTNVNQEGERSNEKQMHSSGLVVKLPTLGQNVRKRNSRALARAYRTIESLKSEIEGLKRHSKTQNKQIERLRKAKQKPEIQTVPADEMSPKRKTMSDIEQLHLTPKRQRLIKRQLLTSNVLMHEIAAAKKVSGKRTVRNIHRIVSGKLAKKYKCLKGIGRSLTVCRRALSRANGKKLDDHKDQRNSLSKNVQERVVDFYNRDDNSRAQPGKSDAKKVPGEKEKVQTKVLTDYIKNLHCKYTSEYPETKMSLSTFTRLRPTNVLLASFISRNTCQCLHHQNMALKIQSLRKMGVRISENPENIILHANDIDDVLDNLPEKVPFKRWEKADIGNGKTKMKVVDKEQEREKFKADLKIQIDVFEKHVERVREQYHQVRELKENLPENEIMLQMDFAEKFSCRSLNEVQTAYWNQTMVTIHPTVAYYRENGELKHRSFVVISDEMTHSASTVCAFLDKILPELKIIKPELKAVHYWTDSPSSQYRNRYIFNLIVKHQELFGLRARWNYFEVGHGKGPCDGLGGTTKRMADIAIRQGHVQIQSAEEFYAWGLNSSMTAKFIMVTTDETRRKQEEMTLMKSKPVKGTMKLHAVGASDEIGWIMTRETSCYCNICLAGSYCDTWKKEEFKCSKVNISLNTEEQTPIEDQGPNQNVNTRNEIPKSQENPITEEPPITCFINEGTYVAAVYEGDWFIGMIKEVDEEEREYEIKFMERAKEMY